MVNPGVQLAYIYFFMLCINKTSTNNQKFPWSCGKFFLTLSDDKTLDWSKLKQIADGILKCI